LNLITSRSRRRFSRRGRDAGGDGSCRRRTGRRGAAPLEQLLDAGRVDVGWDTSGVDAGSVFGDAVTLRMRAVDGPADVHVELLRLPAGERGATTWTFPAPGRYTLALAVEAHLLTGEPVTTEERYTVAVRAGDLDDRRSRRRSRHRPLPAGSC
jgi:surface-anchored protein